MNDHDREREALIQRLVQDSSDMLYRMSIPDGVCEYVSPACLEITGYCAEEIYSTPKFIKKAIHPDWRDYVKLQWKNILRGKIEADTEYKIIRKSGSERWLHQKSRLVCEADGRPSALEGYVSDVTERKLAEHALRESEQRFRDLAENSIDWIWEMDTRMTCMYSNQRVMDVIGYTPAEVLGKTMIDFIPDQEVPRLRQYVLELQKNPHPYRNYEYRCLHKDGSLRILEGNGIPIYDSAGCWRGYRGVDRDITNRKKTEEELRKHHDHLDALVKERTTKLTKAHDQLKLENEKRKATEAALRAREKEVKRERQEVNEVNAALKVLLKQREQDKTNMGEDVVSNIRISVLPLLEKLGNSTLDASQREILSIAKSRLNEIASPFTRRISSEFLSFTPSEIKVAALIREGKTSKDIADFLHVSLTTVITHRYNIRKKTGIKNKKLNLRAHLQTLE